MFVVAVDSHFTHSRSLKPSGPPRPCLLFLLDALSELQARKRSMAISFHYFGHEVRNER